MAQESELGKDDEIDLLHALKTAFSTDGDPEMFLARAGDQIRQVEGTIIDTCAKHRLRIDENLYALLECRDAIGERASELDKCCQTATDTNTTVNAAVEDLSDKMIIRKNLDAALGVAARTRKLTRMYARVEDTLDARRLYTALQMLRMLEEETRAVLPNTVLQELVPDTRRLRTRLINDAMKGLQTWLKAVQAFERVLGSYALRHAAGQAMSQDTMLDGRRGALGEPFALLPLLPPAPPRGHGGGRPWTPMVTGDGTPEAEGFGHMGTTRRSRMGLLKLGGVARTSGPDLGGRKGGLGRVVVGGGEEMERAPCVFLRPLLQAGMVGEGLGLLGELRMEYRKERMRHLQDVLEGVEEREEEVEDAEGDERRVERERVEDIERLVSRVAGVFVVERAVEVHARQGMVSREVVDGEWWSLAYAKLLKEFKAHEESGLESGVDKERVRALEADLERFAEANGLIE